MKFSGVINFFKESSVKTYDGSSLAVQWSGLRAFTADGLGSKKCSNDYNLMLIFKTHKLTENAQDIDRSLVGAYLWWEGPATHLMCDWYSWNKPPCFFSTRRAGGHMIFCVSNQRAPASSVLCSGGCNACLTFYISPFYMILSITLKKKKSLQYLLKHTAFWKIKIVKAEEKHSP